MNVIKVIKNIIKKNIKKVKVKEQSQKHYKLSMYYARIMVKLIQYFLAYNVKMRKNQRPFTGSETNVKLSLAIDSNNLIGKIFHH